MIPTRRLLPLALVCLGLSASVHADTNAWPCEPVRVQVGFAVGGPTGVIARAFARYDAIQFKQPFVVENRPGANTILAAPQRSTLLPEVPMFAETGMTDFAAQIAQEIDAYTAMARTLNLSGL